MNKIYFLFAWYGILLIGLLTLIIEGNARFEHIEGVALMMGIPTILYWYFNKRKNKQYLTNN